MPLLHDTSRGGGGSNENRRSMAEFLGLDMRLAEPPAAAPASARQSDYGGDPDWCRESPSSPEMAQSPRALVPLGCFPPRHPRAFASYSERAQPGAAWDDTGSAGITDLVASLKALGMPGPGPMTSPPPAITFTRDDGSGFPELNGTALQNGTTLMQNGTALMQNGTALMQNGTASILNGTASMLNDTASLMHHEARISMLSRRSSFCGNSSSSQARGTGNGNGRWSWSGVLPTRDYATEASEFSPKLFLGGLPWDITESTLMHALRHFHPMRVEWPGRESGAQCPRGFAYITLDGEKNVHSLLAACRRDQRGLYYRLHSRKSRTKDVEVIPWAVCDANWMSVGPTRLAAARTVFVGALHGLLSAPTLALIMNELFSGVIYAGIDTDKNKYPIGSGRVTFDNVRSYVRAISAAYIDIQTDKFSKKVQVDPYLEDSMCSVCNLQQGPYFCREPTCFGYFCRSCWSWQHYSEEHKPLMRNSKGPVQTQSNGHRRSPSGDNGTLSNGYRHSPPGDHGSLTNEYRYSPLNDGTASNASNGYRHSPPGDHGTLPNGYRRSPPGDHGTLSNEYRYSPPSENGNSSNGYRCSPPRENGNSSNGHRYSPPSDHGTLYNGNDDNPSPPGSGGGTAEAEAEAEAEADADCELWPH